MFYKCRKVKVMYIHVQLIWLVGQVERYLKEAFDLVYYQQLVFTFIETPVLVNLKLELPFKAFLSLKRF